MLEQLKQYGESNGNLQWGLGGPHDVPTYDQPPSVDTFFKDQGGSWETPYGVFFLSWYSSKLISHGDHILSLASSCFRYHGISYFVKDIVVFRKDSYLPVIWCINNRRFNCITLFNHISFILVH